MASGDYSHVIVDGEVVPAADAAISVFDIALLRGYGCFEALRAYDGRVFRVAEHLDRLRRSAQRMGIGLPPENDLADWIRDRAALAGDCIVRVIITGGIDPGSPGTGSRAVVLAEPAPSLGSPFRMLPLEAPWHTDAASYRLTGAKTLSYAPNFAATLTATERGYDDALLIGRSGLVLEGPTFGVGWIAGGTIETPSLDLGILESITRSAMVEIAGRLELPVNEGRFDLPRLLAADEAFVMSTTKDILAVGAVGDVGFEPGPVTAALAAAFDRLVADELGPG